MTEKKTRDLLDKLLGRGAYCYGTSEYWEKERKAKFRINARQKEERAKKFGLDIINLWAMSEVTKPPLYHFNSISKEQKQNP